MKIKVALLTALIVLSSGPPSRARKSSPRPLFLETPITMNGAGIPEGMYELALETSSTGVEVTLWREGQFIASARGVWVKSGAKYKENAMLLRVNSDGSRSLIEIRLAGMDKAIVLNTPDAVMKVSSR